MKSGWTGGQYSLVRALAGVALAVRFAAHVDAAEPMETALEVSIVVASLLLALGWAERSTAMVLAPLLLGLPAVAAAAALAYGVLILATSVSVLAHDASLSVASCLAGIPRQSVVFAAMHWGYGLGFLCGLLCRRPHGSTANVRATYARYAADRRLQRAWSESDPGQLELLHERDRALARALAGHFGARRPLDPATGPASLSLLDLGSGDGALAAALRREGITVSRVVAVDLLHERLGATGLRAAADARRLPFVDGAFDAAIQCTMLSSIHAEAARRLVAAEMTRVVRPGGLVLSYDARFANPFNRDVRRVTRAEHRALFADGALTFESLTLVPPLARLVTRLAPRFAAWLAHCRWLHAFDLVMVSLPETAPDPESTR